MTRPARRDVAVFIIVLALVVATAVLALLDLTGWAIALLAVLVGAAALMAQMQFTARRSTYQRLRRESHSTREATKHTIHLAKAIIDRLQRIEGQRSERVVDTSAPIEAARKDIVSSLETVRADVSRSRDALRADAASSATELAALRAELRGVRVAQQLFSQALGGVRVQVDEIVSVSADAAMKQDLHELARLAEIVAQLGDAATKADLTELAKLSDAARGAVAQDIREAVANDFREVVVAEIRDRVARDIREGVATDLREVVVADMRDGVARSIREGVAHEVSAKLRPTINSLEWEIRRQRPELISDLQAMQQLFDRFAPAASLPAVAGWAMSPGGLLMLTDEIAKRGSDLVVECGSGASTLWMAFAMREQGHGKVVALEHLPEFAEKTRAMLQAHGVAEWAEVRDAPLTTVSTPQGDFQWYDTTGMRWDHEIDMLLVDGPPTKTGPHARYPALSTLADVLAPSALLVVDDADRQDEQEVIALWQQERPELVHRYSPGRGIEVFSLSAAG